MSRWLVGLALVVFCLAGCQSSETLLAKGNVAFRAGELARAESLYREAYRDPQTRLAASFNLGRVYLVQNKPQQALERLQEAEPLASQDSTLFFYQAKALARLSRNPEAIERLEVGLRLYPTSSLLWLELATVQAASGHYKQAIFSARKARADAFYLEPATLLLARCLEQDGEIQEAIKELERLLQDRAYRTETYLLLANLYSMHGQPQKAKELLDKARSRDPKNPRLSVKDGLERPINQSL